MLAGAGFFSAMAALTHELRDVLSWQTIALVRTGLALVIAAAMTYAAGARFVFLRPATLWIRSLAGSCSLVLTFYALTHSHSLSAVLVLTNMFPVWVALLSWPVLGTVPNSATWVAIACGMTGVIVIQQPSHANFDFALLAAALGSLTTSIAMLGLHRLYHLDPRSIVVHFSGVSVLFCLAAHWLPQEKGYEHLDDPLNVAMLLGVGVTATMGQLFLTKAFAAGSPAKVSVVGLSQVGITACVDLWHNHTFSSQRVIGMLLIIAPTIWLLLRSDAPAATTIMPPDETVPPQVE